MYIILPVSWEVALVSQASRIFNARGDNEKTGYLRAREIPYITIFLRALYFSK